VDNGLDGFDWHDLNNGAHLKTFGTGPLKEKYPRQVRLVEGGRVIVGGGENGRVYLFDTHSGGSLGTLRHDTDHLIQTINVRTRMSKREHILTFPISYRRTKRP